MRARRSGESEGTRSGCDFKACLDYAEGLVRCINDSRHAMDILLVGISDLLLGSLRWYIEDHICTC